MKENILFHSKTKELEITVNIFTLCQSQTDLRKVAMHLVQDLYDHIHLVHLSVVPQLLPHATEDLGEGSLAQTVVLKTILFILKSRF